MSTKVFINLPVKDLTKSIEFFTSMGFSFNNQFTDETAACLVFSEHVYAMLLTHQKFSEFTNRKIADTSNTVEVLNCLSFESRDRVNELVDKAVAAGAVEAAEPKDYGFMYFRSFNDLDGHTWELMWMDPANVQQEQPAGKEAVA